MSSPLFKDHRPDEMAAPPVFGSQSQANRPVSRLGRIDPAAIARAEAALRGLAAEFGQWLHAEVEKLQAARAAVHTHGLTLDTANQLYGCAHDLKGLGTTYEFPIITRISGMLCKVLGDGERRLGTPMELLDAHVDAIVACLRDNTRDPATAVGLARIQQLERAAGFQAP